MDHHPSNCIQTHYITILEMNQYWYQYQCRYQLEYIGTKNKCQLPRQHLFVLGTYVTLLHKH